MLPHPLHAMLSWLFLLTGFLKALLRGTPARSNIILFQVQGKFSTIISTQKVEKQGSLNRDQSREINKKRPIKKKNYYDLLIRECGSSLYVGLV